MSPATDGRPKAVTNNAKTKPMSVSFDIVDGFLWLRRSGLRLHTHPSRLEFCESLPVVCNFSPHLFCEEYVLATGIHILRYWTPEGLGVGRGRGLGCGRGIGAGVTVGVALGVTLGVAVGVGVSVAVGVAVGVAVAVPVGVGEGVPQSGETKCSLRVWKPTPST